MHTSSLSPLSQVTPENSGSLADHLRMNAQDSTQVTEKKKKKTEMMQSKRQLSERQNLSLLLWYTPWLCDC